MLINKHRTKEIVIGLSQTVHMSAK